MRHLLTLDGMARAQLIALMDAADALLPVALGAGRRDALRGRAVGNLFFEPSTRTRTSFQLAAQRLGADVVNFDAIYSSTKKGETLLDTLRNLEAMGATTFVVRHSESSALSELVAGCRPTTSIVNAGDGRNAHPTQGLLDMLTIRQHRGTDFAARRVAIVGDVKHSRVARSDLHALRTLGVRDIRMAAPATLLPGDDVRQDARVCASLEEALDGADVVMLLRLQRERMDEGFVDSLDSYHRDWGLTASRLRHAARDALVMHPGPMNRGVEIADDVADGPQSVILQQVANGVAMRMAVLLALRGAD